MKLFLSFLVGLALLVLLGTSLVQAAGPISLPEDNFTQVTKPINPIPGLSWTSNPCLGQGWWEPGALTALAMCPFCGRQAEIMQTHRNHPVFGFEMIEWTLYCETCQYTTERDLSGTIKSITKEAQADWGARNWEINEARDPLIHPLFVPIPVEEKINEQE